MTVYFWRNLFWISYFAWLLFEAWAFSRDRRAVEGRKDDRGSVFVIVALILVAVAIAFLSPWLAPWARIAQRNPIIPGVALLLIWGGMGFRLWAIQTLGKFFRTTVTIQDGHELVTAGPYRVLRHPAYTGAVMTIAGIGLYMNNWVSFVGAFGVALIAYSTRIRVEERALGERFGASFQEHRARTWAVIPAIW